MQFRTLEEKLEGIFYNSYSLGALAAEKLFGASKYTSSRATTLAGILASGVYGASVTANCLDHCDNWFAVSAAGLIITGYSFFYADNFKRANVAEKRRDYLSGQLLESVLEPEEQLQREHYVPAAKWFFGTELLIPVLAELTGGFRTAEDLVSVGALMFATSCIYGARYVLLSKYSSKEYKKINTPKA